MGENVRKRLDLNRIGFGSSDEQSLSESDSSSFLGKAETRDFIDYGFEPEFIGRLPVRVACEELKEDDLGEIFILLKEMFWSNIAVISRVMISNSKLVKMPLMQSLKKRLRRKRELGD